MVYPRYIFLKLNLLDTCVNFYLLKHFVKCNFRKKGHDLHWLVARVILFLLFATFSIDQMNSTEFVISNPW